MKETLKHINIETLKHIPFMLLALAGVRWAQKKWGTFLGYGHCAHCKMPWLYAKPKCIHYSETSGMFPLCEDCFNRLSLVEIKQYITHLVLDWVQLGWDNDLSPREVIEAAYTSALLMKSGLIEFAGGLEETLAEIARNITSHIADFIESYDTTTDLRDNGDKIDCYLVPKIAVDTLREYSTNEKFLPLIRQKLQEDEE